MKAKRILSVLLALCLLLCVLPLTASAAESGSCGYSAVWNFDPATGALSVDGGGAITQSELYPWHAFADQVTSLRVGDGITIIPRGAFAYLANLKTVSLPATLTSIRDSAFEGCESLYRITLKEGLNSLGAYCFYQCASLPEITIPASVTSIGEYCFNSCPNLKSIKVADGNRYYTSDSSGVLFNKAKTTLIAAPGALEGRYTVPDGVKTISPGAFFNCDKLTRITLPETVSKLYNATFADCQKLTEIKVDSDNPYCSSDSSGVLYNKAKTYLWQYPAGKTGSCTVRSGVQVIDTSAFLGCTGLTKITLPKGLTAIHDEAFAGCTGITSISIPSTVTKIGDYAFTGCTGLTEFTLPASVPEPGDWLLAGCTALERFTGPDSMKSVTEGMFYGCTELSSVYPAGFKAYRNECFFGCVSLMELDTSKTTYFGSYAFSGTGISQIECSSDPEARVYVQNYAFLGCPNLTKVNFSHSTVDIQPNAFYGITAEVAYCANPCFSWNEQKMLPYGGELTWIPYWIECEAHAWKYWNNTDGQYTWFSICLDCGARSFRYTKEGAGKMFFTDNPHREIKSMEVIVDDAAAGQHVTMEMSTNYWQHSSFTTTSDPNKATRIQVTMPENTTLTLTLATAPVDMGNLVQKVYPDGSRQNIYDTVATEKGVQVTLDESCTLIILDKGASFPDVPDGFWAEQEIAYMTSRGYISGKLNGTFAPTEAITRKTLAMILWRMAGEPIVPVDTTLSDVNLNDRYTQPICWAEDAGIITGYGDGTFRGDGQLSRQHFAVMLYRYAKYMGISLTPENEKDLADFTDFDTISASFHVQCGWAVNNGLINGRADGSFDPQGNTSRAQLAVILTRFLRKIG